MHKQENVFEIKKNDRFYRMHIPSDAPLGEIHDVLREMLSYLINMMQERAKPVPEMRVEPKIYTEPEKENV